MTTYYCDDGNGGVEIEADSPKGAAQAYVDGGDWGDVTSTIWINVHVGGEQHKIALDPDEPECDGGLDHIWSDRHEIVGGIKENPGVWGHGGGVKMHYVCVRCGCKRIYDNWAQDPEDGTQGLDSVEYIERHDSPDDIIQTLLREVGAGEDELEYAWGCSAVDLFPAGATDNPMELLHRVREAMEGEELS